MIRLLACLALGLSATALGATFDGQSTRDLEARQLAIQQELNSLARASLRGGVGSIGYRTKPVDDATLGYWIEINLERTYPIDEVVLVPVLWRDMEEGFRADAFPVAFQIIAGTDEDREGHVIAEYIRDENVGLGISPLILTVPETQASWIRLEVTQLSKRQHDDAYVFQLAEVFVFSGNKNVALRCPVETPSRRAPFEPSGAWDASFLVDGATPYLMNSARGDSSHGYIGGFGKDPTLLIDLGEIYSLSEIHLHAVEQSDTVPQAFAGDLGIPKHFRIEVSLTPEFTDPVVLLDYQMENVAGLGPIMMWNIPETCGRYVRVVTIEKSETVGVPNRLSRTGFAEIELLSNGVNVAEGKPAWTVPEKSGVRPPQTLTDGMNLFGEILPMRRWMHELAQRHQLNLELQDLMTELNFRHQRQERMVRWMARGLVALVFVVIFVVLYNRMLRIRHEARVRERIAANLHDELGANLHAIGLWSDIAQQSVDSPDSLQESLQRIRGLTERTGASARFCSNMLEAKGVCEDLVDDMKREASRLLADIQYEIHFDGEVAINALKRRVRIDIYLFFKEALTNIIRHGEASSAQISLSVKNHKVELVITDDGCGVTGGLPKSLQRRAKLMRAKAGVEHPEQGGTRVWLKLKAR
ncbi:histidine kinase [Coraliomargarita algicola]|uniref:histidine kinase n=1 Tax=Coraliomargarita algicola TaxID=3092156 RepID=A0ABZ0RM44_9BACT|nr:histidine kinase [Coraliomargarita sp. J2-16]WPJ97172.1 histidine kinase [Coraliomargarita sp. J2-16]